MALDTIHTPKPGLPVFAPAPRHLTLVARQQDTSDTVSFTFRCDGAPLRHLPGQAIALDLPMPSGTATRTFTIASAPLGGDEISVTVKAGEGSYATAWMHSELQVGQQIRARGPFGRFSLARQFGRPLLLIGGGSGFTPMMSMLRWLHARGETLPVTVVQVARRVEDLLYGPELSQIAAEMPNLTLIDVVTAPAAGEVWRGYRGRPDRAMLRAMAPDASTRETYCCGPEAFMAQIRRCLQAEGLPPAQFHTESFGAATPKPAAKTASPEGAHANGHSLSFRGRSLKAAEDTTLTAAFAAQNIRVPTGCNAGQCGTCKLRLLEGEVDMQLDGGLSDQEVAAGYILACCSRAKTDLTLADPA